MPSAFANQYHEDNSLLLPQYRLRAHNQYITYLVTFGFLGIIIFGFSLIYPFLKNKMYNDYFYMAFFSIILLSMLTEDTLETQIGITFFCFFQHPFFTERKRLTLFILKANNQLIKK